MKKQIVRLALGSALALAFTLPTANVAFGDTSADCHRKLESDRAKIDRDAARHGENSGQVNRDVARMDGDRNWCREHHSDWDHDRFDVGIYFKH